MRRERLYLADILEASKAIAEFLVPVTEQEFLESDLVRSAVLQKLMIIGEAASRMPPDLTNANPQVPWADIIGFRNIAVHAYFNMKWEIVWVIASEEVPKLSASVALMLENLEN